MNKYLYHLRKGLLWSIIFLVLFSIFYIIPSHTFEIFTFFIWVLIFILLGAPFYSILSDFLKNKNK